MATNPWEMDWRQPQASSRPAPANVNPDPIIKRVDPQEAALKGIQIATGQANLTERNLPSLSTGYRWKNGVVGGDQEPIPGGPADVEARKAKNDSDKIGVEQGKAGGFYLRASRSNDAYNARGIGAESLGLAGARAVLPDAITNQFVDPDRQQAEARMRDFIAATLRYESGAAIPPEEFESQAKTYFPQPGDGPDVIKEKEELRANAIEALKLSAGSVAGQVDSDGARSLERIMQANPTRDFVQGNGPAPQPSGEPVFGDDPRAERQAYRMAPENESVYGAWIARQQGNPSLTIEQVNGFLSSIGEQPYDAADPKAQQFLNNLRAGKVDTGTFDYSAADAQHQAQVDDYRKQDQAINGSPGAGRLVEQGMTFGLSDEATGVGNAVAKLLTGDTNVAGNYQVGRDAYRQDVAQAREQSGGWGTAAELGGAVLSARPSAVISALAPSSLRGTMAAGAKAAAPIGALAGYGYGERAGGSVGGAVIGGVAGGALGAAIPLAGRGVNALIGKMPTRGVGDLGIRATPAEVAAAGQAEGVTVRRAMVDPGARNRVIGAEKSLAGGPAIQSGMRQAAREIESGVEKLGVGGTKMEQAVAGNAIQDVSERIIEKTGAMFRRRYDRAVQLAGGVKLEATKANAALDDTITRLSKTPTTNKAEIEYLSGLKSDLSKPIDVEGLRDLRTALRKRIAKGELVFGQNEARVLGVMDALSDDISTGLRAAGKTAAANLFTATDRGYRQRMEFIQSTIQKLVGKRGSTLTPGQVMANFRAMATPKGNEAGLGKMIRAMTPDERADIAATFADALGKNNNGEFSTAFLASQAENLPEAARRHLFGLEGAESLKNLVTLAKAHKAVPMAGSPTGAANDYRSWLGNLVMGAGIPLAAGGGGATMAAGAVGMGALKGGRDFLSARALMSPKITKWITAAPRPASPSAIDAHFRRLGTIAAQEPALAGDIQVLQQRIMESAQMLPRGAVAGEDEDQRRPKPPQG